MSNPYHDERGRFASGPGGGAKQTMEGDRVRIAPHVGGGRGEIVEFSTSGNFANVKTSKGIQSYHMSDLTVSGRGEAGRISDIKASSSNPYKGTKLRDGSIDITKAFASGRVPFSLITHINGRKLK